MIKPAYHRVLAVLLACALSGTLQGQPLVSRTGRISFFSQTPLEDIDAENRQVQAAVDFTKKQLAFAALLKGFLFERALMQEHFNENYVESDKFPKTTFNGSFTGDVNLERDGKYPVTVKGNLTLHGVTRALQVPALFEVGGGKVVASCRFFIRPEDYKIKVPHLVTEKIARQIEVRVNAQYLLSKQ